MKHPSPPHTRPCLRCALTLAAVLGLGGCGLPPRASAPQLYDLGPPPAAIVPAAVQAAPMALALQVQAAPALQDAALHYRLAYADARQLHAYSQSRWAAPAADLLAQRLRLALAPQAALAAAEEAATQLLHVELLEFSQVYTAPQTSHALLRLRATLLQRGPGGWRLQAQREFAQQQTAARADAAAGVQALAAAADEAAVALAQWLRALR